MKKQEISIKRVLLTTVIIILIFVVVIWLIKILPITREYYCKWTGGDVIYPALQWTCVYNPSDIRYMMK